MKINSFLRKMITGVLSFILAFTVINTNVLAAPGDLVYFNQVADSFTEHDVLVKYATETLERTIYCLQKDYVWPKEQTKYYEVGNRNILLNDAQLGVIRKVLLAGYPYNNYGCMDPIYDVNSDFILYADLLAAIITQDVIWTLLEEWGVEGNTPPGPGFERDHEFEMGEAYKALLDYAHDDSIVITDPKDVPDTVSVTGDSTFKLDNDGLYTTGKLKVTGPSGYKWRFEYELPAGIKAVDLNGDELAFISEGKEFRLVTDDLANITAGASLDVKKVFEWPLKDVQYKSEEFSPSGIGPVPFQIMICLTDGSKDITGTMNLAADEMGSITVSKDVENKYLDAAKNETFWFEADLVVKNHDNNQIKGWFPFVKTDAEGSNTNGQLYLFSDGKMRFGLKADEKIEIRNIPVGSTYEITEYGLEENGTDLEDWTPSYTNNSGSIADSTLVKVKNTYAHEPKYLENIKGKKKLLDTANNPMSINAGDYSFTIFGDVHGQPMPEDSHYNPLTNRGEKVVTNKADGTIDFGTIAFDKVGEYSYTIIENQVTVANVTKDMCHWHLVVNVTSDAAGNLTVDPTYTHHHDDTHTPTPGCTHNALEFENRYNPSEIDKDIRVTKAVINHSSDKTLSRAGYEFEITPDMSSKPDSMSDADYIARFPKFNETDTSITVKTGVSGEAFSGILKFKDTWFAAIDTNHDNKVELVYSINEKIPSVLPEGFKYDTRKAVATIVITKVAEGTPSEYTAEIKYAFVDESGNKLAESTEPITFVNEYTASGSDKFDIDLTIDPSDYIPADGEKYEFIINDEFERNGDKSGYTLPDSNKITLTYNSGVPSFGSSTIVFNKAGDYRFEISQIPGNNPGMSYDSSKWIVDIKVADKGDGTLEITKSYYSEHGSSSAFAKASFRNEYKTSVSATLDIKKVILGREWSQYDEFAVVLHHAELGTNAEATFDPIDLANLETNHDNMSHPTEVYFGNVNKEVLVENIKFHKAGIYYLYLREIDRSANSNMIYDKTSYVVRYDVKKAGNDLKVDSVNVYDSTNGFDLNKKLDVTKLVFTNKVTNYSLKVENNEGPATDKFNFTLTLKDKNDAVQKNVTISATLNGSIISLNFDEFGKSDIDLKRGDVLKIVELPNGFKVEATMKESLNNKTTHVTKTDGVAGSVITSYSTVTPLAAGVINEVIYTNVYTEPLNPTPDPTPDHTPDSVPAPTPVKASPSTGVE